PCSAGRDSECLRTEGGLACQCHFLIKDGRPIRTTKALAAAFAPVDSEAEAIAFVVASVPDLRMAAEKVAEGHSLVGACGYLVQVVRKHTFGCGSHQPTGAVFHVARDGTVREVAAVPEPPQRPGELSVCVD